MEASLPFGKHAGKPLYQVPTGYLRWLLANVRLDDGLHRAIVARILGKKIPELIDIEEQVLKIVKPIQ